MTPLEQQKLRKTKRCRVVLEVQPANTFRGPRCVYRVVTSENKVAPGIPSFFDRASATRWLELTGWVAVDSDRYYFPTP